MKLLTVTPSYGGGGAVREIARFDLQLSDDVRLYGLRLMQTPERPTSNLCTVKWRPTFCDVRAFARGRHYCGSYFST